MADYPEAGRISAAVKTARRIVVVQADNPDGDSVASALALEEILSDQDKQIYLYCGVDIPVHLRYMPGADRVSKDLPHDFDLSIIVDTSSDLLLEQLSKTGQKAWLAARPSIVIDHHTNQSTITFAEIICSQPAVATCEVIYELAQQNGWEMNTRAREYIAIGILSDSLGLTTESTTGRSIHIIGELVDSGVSMAELENARRETMRRDAELVHYKGELLRRVEFHDDGRIATITIPNDEIVKYSPLYNPPMLVLDDMRLARDVRLAIAFKSYDDGKVTAKIRANYGSGVADKLAERFGGGGHPYAAGFKLLKGQSLQDIKTETIKEAQALLDKIND